MIHQSLIMMLGSISLSAPFVAAILMLVIGGWMFATRVLGKEFHRLTTSLKTKEEETLPAEKPEPAMASTD